MTSNLPVDTSPDELRRQRVAWRWFRVLFIIAIGLGLLNLHFWGVFSGWRPLPAAEELEAPAELSFDGESTSLHESSFVATLERPIAEGKSAIWCAGLPMAWQELEKAYQKPVQVLCAEDVCRELTNTPRAELNPEHYFAAGGFVKDGIHDRIRANFAQRFPNAKTPKLPSNLQDEQAIAFAFLEVALLYDYVFHHDEKPLNFREAGRRETPVHAFGLREKDKGVLAGHSREQVLVLFRDKDEFAVDLSHNTKPYQIVLARMNRKSTLKDTLDQLDKRIAANSPKHLSEQSVILVPTMNWRIDHRYRELEGPLANGPIGWQVDEAFQSIQFKMDRKGAHVLFSGALSLTGNGHEVDLNPDYFLFDRPFLIVMKKRGAQMPFFVMWVDNAELLQRHSSRP